MQNKGTLSVSPAPQAAANENKTNEQLIASQACADKYREFYDNAPTPFQALDENGCLLDINPMWLTTLGYERNEVMGKWFGDYLHPEDVEHFKISYPVFKKLGSVSDVQFRLRRNDGAFIHVSFEGRIGYTPEGKIKQSYCVFKDITAQKTLERDLLKAKARVEESEEMFIQIAETIGEVFWLRNADNTRMLYINPAYEKVWGCTRQSLYDNPQAFIDSVYDEDKPAVLAEFGKYIQGGGFDLEYRITRPDGSIRWVQAHSYPVRNEAGDVVKHAGTAIDITERKLAEEQIKFQGGIIDNSPLIAAFHDKDLNVVWVNKAYQKATGLSLEEVKGRKCYQVWNLSIPCVGCPVVTAIETGEIASGELTPENQDHWPQTQGSWLSKASPVRDVHGNVIGALEFAIDITDRKLAEFAMRESEERFKALHNASFGGIAIHDHGVVMDCNQGLLDMTGYTREELIGMNGYLLIAPESRQLVLENVNANLEKPYEAMGIRKNGETFPIRVEARNIPYKGRSVRTVEFRDMTEQKLAERKLKESEKDLKETQRIARLGSWHLDIATNKVEWSEEIYKIYGFDPTLPLPPYPEHQKLFTKESWEILSTTLANTVKNGTPHELELNTVLPDGTNGWLWVYGQTVVDENGVVIGLSGAAQDITERIKAEEEKEMLKNQLNQAHKMELLGQLAGGIAHDFNNLLTVILGYSAELSSNPVLDSVIKTDAQEIYKAGARAKRLTQQLLTFSRKQVIQAVVMDLNELIANLRGIFDRLIGAHVTIVCQSSVEKAMVKVDRIQIEQAVINLVLNSRDAMPGGGKVTIGNSVITQTTADMENQFQVKPGKYVQLFVTDTGCGIPKELQSRLFEPFFTTKAQGKGLGLGLPNVMSIVKSSGGGIGVESTPGIGTTFSILLPYCAELHTSEDMELVEKDLNGNGELILVVEDEEALSVYFQKMISKFGYEVTVANSGAEALLLLDKGLQPAVVITDIIMPGMNGKDLADRIVLKNPEQKVMFMSGFTDDILQPLGVIGGNILYIQKPFTAPELAKTIKTLLAYNPSMNAKPIMDAAEAKVSILMLDDDESLRLLVLRACNKAGHHFMGVQNLTDALLALDKEEYDVLLIDDNLEDMTGAEALQKIRAEGYSLPAIGISGVLNTDRVKSMEDAGVIKVMEKSFDLQSLIDAAVEAAKQRL